MPGDDTAWEDDEEAVEAEEPAGSTLELTAEQYASRLDRWLAEQLPDRSRSEVQRWIREGRVRRGGVVLKASAAVAPGDAFVAQVPAAQEYEVTPEPIPLAIVYEDDDLLVVDKPGGMVVHPAAGNWHGTLVNAVLHHCPDLVGVGGARRPGIVHRLDKDTSGLIVVAKNDSAHRNLQAQFRERQVRKQYLALVYGHVLQQRGEIQASIGRDPKQRKRMAVVPSGTGRASVTCFEVIGYYAGYTLLACRPLTGRTHQIRVHLAYIKHPLVGDTVYGGRRKTAIRVPRQFLHAERLSFRLPGSGVEIDLHAPLPNDLEAVLAELGIQ